MHVAGDTAVGPARRPFAMRKPVLADTKASATVTLTRRMERGSGPAQPARARSEFAMLRAPFFAAPRKSPTPTLCNFRDDSPRAYRLTALGL